MSKDAPMIPHEITKASHSKNEKNDCAVCALAIACDYDYDDVHWILKLCGRKNRRSTLWDTTEKALALLRFRTIDVTSRFRARTIRTLEREMRGVKGNYLVRVRRHVLPIVDGQVHDWTKGRCHRIRYILRLEETDKDTPVLIGDKNG